MKSYLAKSRLVPLVLIFGMILLIFCGVLYNTQILNGSDYKARSMASNATAQTVEASRGIVTDRNGKVLISNRLTYTLVFSDEEFEGDTDCNDAIFRLLELCRSNNVKWTDTLPVSKEPPFTYTTPTDEGAFRKYLESEDLPAITVGTLRPTQEAPLFMAQLRKLYGVADSYSDTDARAIIGVRYQLALRDIAGGTYTFASDVSVELINQVVDGRYAGVTTGTASARVYDTTYAAHVLGRLSPIYQEDWVGDPDNGIVGYRDKGYSMDALVGESGVEKAFEEYLHGENGTKLITTTSDGQITGEFYTKEPKPGNTVALTLDIDLQEDVEKALSKTISDMTEEDGIRRYVHMGTGNYNDSTAKLYTDCGIFTCKESIGEDATAVFNMLSGYSEPLAWNELVLAPYWLRDKFLRLIGRETKNAQQGREARIVAKMNSLCDPGIIAALYEASASGVKIDPVSYTHLTLPTT